MADGVADAGLLQPQGGMPDLPPGLLELILGMNDYGGGGVDPGSKTNQFQRFDQALNWNNDIMNMMGTDLRGMLGMSPPPEDPGPPPMPSVVAQNIASTWSASPLMAEAFKLIEGGATPGTAMRLLRAKVEETPELADTLPPDFAQFNAAPFDAAATSELLTKYATEFQEAGAGNAEYQAEKAAWDQQAKDYEDYYKPRTRADTNPAATTEQLMEKYALKGKADPAGLVSGLGRREPSAASTPSAPSAGASRLAGPPGPGFRSDVVAPAGRSTGQVPGSPGATPTYSGSAPAAIRGGYNGPPGPGFRPEGPVPASPGGFGPSQSFPQGRGGIPQGGAGIPQGGPGIPQGGAGIPPAVANQLLMEMAERTVGNGLPTPFGRGGISPRNIPVPAPPSDVPTVGIPQTDGGIPTPTVGIPQGAGGIPTPTVGIPQTGGGIPIPTVGIPQTDGGIPEIPGVPGGAKGTVSVPAPVAEELVSGLAARRQGGPPGPGFRTAPQPDSGIKRNLDQLTALGQQNLQNMKMPSRQQQDNAALAQAIATMMFGRPLT